MPLVIRWPGVIKPGTLYTKIFAALDWLPTFVDIAGGFKGNDLKAEIEKGVYPGIVKTTLDGFDQTDYLTGKSKESARDHFFYFDGPVPAAVRYKNWKLYYQLSQPGAVGWMLPTVPLHWTGIGHIGRDPFEPGRFLGEKTAFAIGGALDATITAYQYDWNILPIGQQLWLKWLRSLEESAPAAPESYNLDQIEQQVKSQRHIGPVSDWPERRAEREARAGALPSPKSNPHARRPRASEREPSPQWGAREP